MSREAASGCSVKRVKKSDIVASRIVNWLRSP